MIPYTMGVKRTLVLVASNLGLSVARLWASPGTRMWSRAIGRRTIS